MLSLFCPTPGVADQRLTVAGTVVTLSAFSTASTAVFVDFQDATVMVTFDGSDPSATNGHRFEPGSSATWTVRTAVAARFIRQGASSGVVHASELTTY